jgi:hypothetical protein
VSRREGVLHEEEVGIATLQHDGEALKEVSHDGAAFTSGPAGTAGCHLPEDCDCFRVRPSKYLDNKGDEVDALSSAGVGVSMGGRHEVSKVSMDTSNS